MKERKAEIKAIINGRALSRNTSKAYIIVKRLFDIVISLLGIMVFLPVFALLAVMLKLESSGTIFLLQEALGLKGKKINIYKFRSLKNAGRWFIKLPGLFNVLKGEMSIVGPLPLSPEDYGENQSWYNLRFSVKPGIMGLWQLNHKNRLDIDEMVRLDLKYIRERSFLYDLNIILKTVALKCFKR
jgi:lipopolysaccharide/colanic/teichoic acid biosynthesis glycosyltransferase